MSGRGESKAWRKEDGREAKNETDQKMKQGQAWAGVELRLKDEKDAVVRLGFRKQESTSMSGWEG